jgi:3-phosphoshikimate 1-carboxyvinyltransferase
MPELETPVTFRSGALRGSVAVPGDKSVSHRALMAAAACRDPIAITGLNPGRDVVATREALISLGAAMDMQGGALIVTGKRLREPPDTIDCMNSGSTARMMLGVCAGANVRARFDGDASLRKRPMEPVAAQLRAFGARIVTNDGLMPVSLEGTPEIETQRFILITPSAQIKSSLLFAGLFANVEVKVHGDRGTRDHTERLLRYLGATVETTPDGITLHKSTLQAKPIHVIGDFSAAAFFIVGACIAPQSELLIENVGVNPTRTGLIDALLAMGADIALRNERDQAGEPTADILVRHAPLHGTSVGPDIVIRAIDEIPILAVAAAFASGPTTMTGIKELRTKESDRVAAIERMLTAVGVTFESTANAITIAGGTPRGTGATIETQHDHRTAMATAMLAAGA